MPALPGSLSRRLVLAGIGIGSAALLAGCGSGSAPATYDLAAPRDGIASGKGRGLIVIAEPQALAALDSNRVVVMTRGGGIAYLPEVQLSDRLPKLFQVRLIQTFENGSRIQAVGRPGDRLLPAAQINSEIRAFGIEEASGDALVEVSIKIVNDRSGRILAGQVFTSRVPGGGAPVAALDLANQALMRDVVKWVSARI